MSKSTYTVEDLQVLDDKCLRAALKMGLTPPPTLFHLVQAEEMYDIAARGLPGRYSHYQFGREYEKGKGNYDAGKGRIYELVINTKPAHAYLLDGNSVIAQFFVMAHVYGHTDFFEHNRYFEPADKNILTRTRAAAERIDYYIGEYGRNRVENFIDSCEAFEYNKNWDQLAKPPAPKEPEWEIDKFASLFPEENQKRREKFALEREAYKLKFPKSPQKDILKFIEKYATHLEDWQRDVISIIRTEAEYFVPQPRTQVMNEGWAVRAHEHIVQSIMAEEPENFTTDDFMEYESSNAGVKHPKINRSGTDEETGEAIIECTGINPYLLGSLIWKDIARICTDPTDKEREQWWWAGAIDPIEKCNEIMRTYDDRVFIGEFLTPKLCEKAGIFKDPRPYSKYKNLRIQKEEFEWLRDYIVDEKTSFGIPVMEITDAAFGNGRSELYLVHRHEGQFFHKGLDDEYVRGCLPQLAELWGRPVNVQTVDVNEETDEEKVIYYRCIPNTAVSRSTTPPKR